MSINDKMAPPRPRVRSALATVQGADREIVAPPREATVGTGEAADALNAALHRAEEAIKGLGLGTRGTVVIENDPDAEWSRHLVFGKREGRWCLFLESGEWGDEFREADLYSASLEIRQLAALQLPALVGAVKAAQSKAVRDLVRIASLVDQFARELPKVTDLDAFVETKAKQFDLEGRE